MMSLKRMLPQTCLVFMIATASVAGGEASGEVSSSSAEEALLVAERAWQRVLEAERVSFELTAQMNTRAQGMRQEMESRYDVRVERPNRLAMVAREGQFTQTIVSDGEKAIVYFPMYRKYYEREASSNFDDLTELGGGGIMGALSPAAFLGTFLSAQSYHGAREMIQGGKYLEQQTRDSAIVHRVSLKFGTDSGEWPEELQEVGDFEMGIEVDLLERDDGLLVERVYIDMTDMIRSTMGAVGEENPEMAEMFRDMEMSYTLTFAEWEFPEEMEEDAFAFTPPESAERIEGPEALFEGLGQPEREAHQLLGQASPQFELEMLDGSTARLEDHVGEKVIVLDFWATWCGPCIQAMPVLMDVTDEYKDQGVLFWAINLRERPDQIRAFVDARDWDLSVPLDPDGSVGDLYQVSGIPQTVIIGKDGTVQAVHIGFSPRLRETLPVELETLLAGGSLIDEE